MVVRNLIVMTVKSENIGDDTITVMILRLRNSLAVSRETSPSTEIDHRMTTAEGIRSLTN